MFYSIKHTNAYIHTNTHTYSQDKGPIECSVVTTLHNKGKLELAERESTQPGPKVFMRLDI